MNVVIWGAGKFGQYVETHLRNDKRIAVKAFVDTNKELWGTKIEGIEVISPTTLYKLEKIDAILVAFYNSMFFYEEIINNRNYKYGFILNRVWQQRLYLKYNLLEDENIVWNDADYIKNMPIIKKLETHIVDYCNLNCRGCSHFSNLYHYGEQIPFEIYCRDLEQVAKNAFVVNFNMLGGEALLNKQIAEYMEYARKLMPYTDIQLISNGLLILKQTESFFESCRKNDIMISISGYQPTLKIRNEIEDILKKNDITYVFRSNVMDFGKNIDLTGSVDKYEAMKRCREHTCHFLRYGKIYKCPFEALGNRFFGHFNIDICLNGGSDIYTEGLNWTELIKRLDYHPVEACKYCGEEERIEWKVTHTPVIEDWVVKQ